MWPVISIFFITLQFSCSVYLWFRNFALANEILELQDIIDSKNDTIDYWIDQATNGETNRK